MAHQGVVAELDARRDRPAEVVTTGVDGVEGRRSPEVDEDGRPFVKVMSRDCIRDPVGAHPPGVVVLDADTGSRAGPDHHRLQVEGGVGKFIDAPRQRGNHAAHNNPG